jgi:hypothetical protein
MDPGRFSLWLISLSAARPLPALARPELRFFAGGRLDFFRLSLLPFVGIFPLVTYNFISGVIKLLGK